jgi:hypothetical protein
MNACDVIVIWARNMMKTTRTPGRRRRRRSGIGRTTSRYFFGDTFSTVRFILFKLVVYNIRKVFVVNILVLICCCCVASKNFAVSLMHACMLLKHLNCKFFMIFVTDARKNRKMCDEDKGERTVKKINTVPPGTWYHQYLVL